MYNIIENVYLFICIMGKLHNIATGVMITWAILGLGKEAFSQTTGNSNGKANVGQVQDSTKKAIVDIDSLDHETIINTRIKDLLNIYWEEKWREIIRNHMLIEINILRSKYDAGPLILNDALNDACQLHSEYMEKNMITTHQGEKFSSPTSRAKDNNYEGYLIYENIGFMWFWTPPTIKNIIQQQIDSPPHFDCLINKRMKDLGFWFKWLYFTTNLWK